MFQTVFRPFFQTRGVHKERYYVYWSIQDMRVARRRQCVLGHVSLALHQTQRLDARDQPQLRADTNKAHVDDIRP